MNCRHTLNPGALSQLNDYNRAPQRLCLRAKRARHFDRDLDRVGQLAVIMHGRTAGAGRDRCALSPKLRAVDVRSSHQFEEEIGVASSENGLFIAKMEFSVRTGTINLIPRISRCASCSSAALHDF